MLQENYIKSWLRKNEKINNSNKRKQTSPLAIRAYKNELQKAHKGLEVELKVMMTKGDKILDTPLAKIGGKGLFTKELEEAMLRGEAHIAVHSLKMFLCSFQRVLKLAVITKREDVRRCYAFTKRFHTV